MLKSIKIVTLFLLIILLILGFAWISGYVFLFLGKLNTQNTDIFTIYTYWVFYSEDPHTKELLTTALFAGFLTLSVPFILFFYTSDNRKLFGDASWANTNEISKSGLFSEDGIIVGKYSSFFGLSDKLLILPDSLHVLLAAPTRSGKGISTVIPNCLAWKDSMVVLDIKQENWNITAGYRAKHGQQCFLLNLAPRDYKTHRWNPLHYISSDPSFRINDIQKIGQMFFPTNTHEAPIWQSSSRSLWLGLVLFLIEMEYSVTLGEVLRQLVMGDKRLSKIIDEKQKSDSPLSEQCYLTLWEYLDTPEKTRGSIRKGFISSLELFYNPVIDAATSGNDFDLRDIRKNKISIYIGISPDDLERLAPLINLFFQQLIDLNTRELPEHNPELKHKCLLLMDEFTSIGKIPILSKGIAYIAGYGLRLLPIIQSPAQIRSVYGHDDAESFIDNHALNIVFAPKNIKVAKEISETLGTMTTSNKSKGKSRPSDFFGKASRSENISEHGRSLLLPQEVMQLKQNQQIILLENMPPIKCEKIKWYSDPLFKHRGNQRDKINFTPPKVPKIKINTNNSTIEFSPINLPDNKTTSLVERPITLKDIENIDNLDLDDFSCDFSSIEIPQGEISDEEMSDLAESFLSTFSN
ncbi:Coupling protein VirD4, ATPase required for T-DNA transfer [Bathymodiolus heckerae thiotrophic gill symbiont]|uniref:type IV secretory system conjugative DNA transfer family protein n=1 Tax=Bathymodiolus heckerae thiotrophic gill symbiont TaxID=1052212 RepID=UPI0010B0665E|nr:type IV secretory system conjugative DNA transfer family protein [Bathymodiolus heckerae thiotrophic gill symbiont]SHN91364.1 Coupling protein VirD4, ATPase required for T-DNA transfer [Bathymodiolus heckerae thiotrophic gill symbiont]